MSKVELTPKIQTEPKRSEPAPVEKREPLATKEPEKLSDQGRNEEKQERASIAVA